MEIILVLSFVAGVALGFAKGNNFQKETQLRDQRVCYTAEDSGAKFEKCYRLVEDKSK